MSGSGGGASPAYRPTAWVYLQSGGCTIRWQRGDDVAYVFEGKALETYPEEIPNVQVLATIPVHRKGWTDLAHVRRLGELWVKARAKRCKCGVYS